MPDILKLKKLTIPPDFLADFTKAKNTFLHQPVFDPITRKIRPLNDYPDGLQSASVAYAGECPLRKTIYSIKCIYLNCFCFLPIYHNLFALDCCQFVRLKIGLSNSLRKCFLANATSCEVSI